MLWLPWTRVAGVFAIVVLMMTSCGTPVRIDGDWIAEFPTAKGQQKFKFHFEVYDQAIKGTIASLRGLNEIANGRLLGKDLTFTELILDDDGLTVPVQYTGRVSVLGSGKIELTRTPGHLTK